MGDRGIKRVTFCKKNTFGRVLRKMGIVKDVKSMIGVLDTGRKLLNKGLENE